jgi:hypothetical protein
MFALTAVLKSKNKKISLPLLVISSEFSLNIQYKSLARNVYITKLKVTEKIFNFYK